MRVLGIDLGTSSCKAGVIDASGALLGLGSQPYPTYRPSPHVAEQEPADWWQALQFSVRQALAAAGGGAESIEAIGLSAHIPTLVLAGSDGCPLRPAVTWQDGRGLGEERGLSRAEAGITLPGSPSWPIPRLRWLLATEPATVQRTRWFLMAKDWIYMRLTGALATDASTWRGLIHMESGLLSDAAAAEVGWVADRLPQVHAPTAAPAQLLPAAAAALGLPAGLPVVVGWNDAWCNLLGSGAVEPGLAFDICGTSELAGQVLDYPEERAGWISAPFTEGLHLLYGPTQAGGSSLEWFGRLHGLAPTEVAEVAAGAPPGSDGVIFLPYLQGERAPHWDPGASGLFAGLRQSHTRAHMARAVLEGVAFSVRQLVTGGSQPPSLLLASGGGARGALWNQIKADILGAPVATVEVGEAGVLGAAVLAAVGAGWAPEPAAAAREMVRRSRIFEPRWHEAYEAGYQGFLRLYPAVRAALEPGSGAGRAGTGVSGTGAGSSGSGAGAADEQGGKA